MTETILTSFETLTAGDVVTVRLTCQWITRNRGTVEGQYRFDGVDSIGEAVFTAPAGSNRMNIVAQLNPESGRYIDLAKDMEISVVVSDDGANDEPVRPHVRPLRTFERLAVGSEVLVRLTPRDRETPTIDRRCIFTELDRNKVAFFTAIEPVGDDEEQTIIALPYGSRGYATDFGATIVEALVPARDLLPAPAKLRPFTVEVSTTVTVTVEVSAADQVTAEHAATTFLEKQAAEMKGVRDLRVLAVSTRGTYVGL